VDPAKRGCPDVDMVRRLGAMGTVLKAVAEPQAVRADRWRETYYSTFAGLDLRLDRAPDECDQMRIGHAGPVQVVESRSGPGQVRRTVGHVRGNDPDRYILFVQAEGTDIGEQNGRSAVYQPGDLGILDLSEPLRCTFTQRRAVLLSYPKVLCPFPAGEIAALTGQRISGRSGTTALISGLVRQLPDHLDSDDQATGARVGTTVLDLLHVGLAAHLKVASSIEPETRRRAMRTRCRAFIETHLADPNLSPAVVAAAHHISLRYLQRLFEDSGDGVAALIRRRRLDRCRRDLLDPGLLDRPVAAVGARWGFGDPAHFTRTFKRAFGLPPAGFRREYLRQHTEPSADPAGTEAS
jgi:AraC-like DNA-binding protein